MAMIKAVTGPVLALISLLALVLVLGGHISLVLLKLRAGSLERVFSGVDISKTFKGNFDDMFFDQQTGDLIVLVRKKDILEVVTLSAQSGLNPVMATGENFELFSDNSTASDGSRPNTQSANLHVMDTEDATDGSDDAFPPNVKAWAYSNLQREVAIVVGNTLRISRSVGSGGGVKPCAPIQISSPDGSNEPNSSSPVVSLQAFGRGFLVFYQNGTINHLARDTSICELKYVCGLPANSPLPWPFLASSPGGAVGAVSHDNSRALVVFMDSSYGPACNNDTLDISSRVVTIAVSPSGKRAIGTEDGGLAVVFNGSKTSYYNTNQTSINALAFRSDKEIIAAGSSEGLVYSAPEIDSTIIPIASEPATTISHVDRIAASSNYLAVFSQGKLSVYRWGAVQFAELQEHLMVILVSALSWASLFRKEAVIFAHRIVAVFRWRPWKRITGG